MKILKWLLGGVLALAVVLCIVGLFLPDTVHVERSIVIQAPQQQVFDTLNSYRRFNEWSPWYERDPQAQYTWSGPETGVGAKLAWSSEKSDVGSGSQTIIESRSPELIRTELDFGEDGKAVAFYRLEPVDGATRVTWGFDTAFEGNILGRYVGLMFDAMLGPDYERGLAKLKNVLEKPAG